MTLYYNKIIVEDYTSLLNQTRAIHK